jgi:PKD repeat protein
VFPLGSKRLRVRIAYLPASAPNMDPCTNYNYGETEDYSVNIVAGTVIAPVANFTANAFTISAGQSVNFTDLSTNNPTSWNWTFTGASPASSTSQNPSNITYNTPGCYQVSLTATNSAGSNTSSQTCYITVTNAVITPVANFSSNSQSITTGQSVNFTDLSTNNPTSWNWTFTGGSPASSTSQNPSNITYNTPGCFQVSLTATNSAGNNTKTMNCYITVNSVVIAPVANFTANNFTINTGQSVNFTDLSTNVPTSWNWTFTGASPSSSTSQNPTNITYNTAGCYQVSLTATNSAGNNTSTQTCYINVTNPVITPVANFSASSVNIITGQSVNFTDLSTNNPTSWNWVFVGAAPASSNSQNPTNIVYNTAGCYQVSLTATNSAGSNTYTQTCYINVTNVNPYCIPAPVNGTNFGDYINAVSIGTISNLNTGSVSGPSYSNYSNLSTNLSTNTAYNIVVQNGTYNNDSIAAWIDYNDDGDFADAGEKLDQVSAPIVNTNYTLNFTVPGTITLGTKRLRVRIAYLPPSAPNMDPCTNYNYGETEDYSVNIVAGSVITPVVNFTANAFTISAGQSVNFTDLSTNNPTSWNWTFNGASPASSTSQNPSNITYNTAGCYQVSLTATNSAGTNTSTQTCYINVTNPVITPVANFTASSVNITTGQSVNFTDLSTNNPTSWNWVFVGAAPASSNSQNPTNIVYNTAGCYQVSLTATNSAGSNTSTQVCYITVLNPIITPIANFTANTQYITVGQLVNFTDISTNNPTSWNWVFTGAVPTSSSLQNPTNITYNTAGCYQVALTATNSAGSNTSTQLCYINVVPAGIQPQASFSINPNPACTNSVVNLLNTSTNALTFNWDMLGASPANSTDQFPVISYDVPGTYTIILTAVNGANTDTVSQSITVYPTPTINAGTDVGICLGSSVTLNAVAAGNYSYNWTPAATLTTPTLSQTLATPNTNTDYVITINDAFCSASDTIAVIVWPLPIAPIIIQVGNTLEATTGFPAYQWYENNVIIPGETQSTITPINNGSYSVDAIDTNGCISTSLAFAFVIQGVNTVSNNQISIYPNPTSNILYINLQGNIQKTRLEIIDAKGKLVLDEEINANASFVSTEQLSTGMYFIRFINANQGNPT